MACDPDAIRPRFVVVGTAGQTATYWFKIQSLKRKVWVVFDSWSLQISLNFERATLNALPLHLTFEFLLFTSYRTPFNMSYLTALWLSVAFCFYQ